MTGDYSEGIYDTYELVNFSKECAERIKKELSVVTQDSTISASMFKQVVAVQDVQFNAPIIQQLVEVGAETSLVCNNLSYVDDYDTVGVDDAFDFVLERYQQRYPQGEIHHYEKIVDDLMLSFCLVGGNWKGVKDEAQETNDVVLEYIRLRHNTHRNNNNNNNADSFAF